MTQPTTAESTFDFLQGCVQHLGAAILAIWGIDDEGNCRCPKGKACVSPGKHPNAKLCPNGVKNATRDPAILRQWCRQAPKGNWALRTGEPIPGGTGFLAAFDWDPRNGSETSLAEIRGRGDELPETVSQASGGGGGHRLYRFPHSPASRSLGPGLDLQGGGKYIVIAPSKHRSGGFYSWDLGCGPGDINIAEAPQWMIEGTGEAQPRPMTDGGTARETVLGEAFALAGKAGPVMPDGVMFVNCPQSHLHGDTRGRGQDASTVILPPAGGSKFGGFSCRHGHCANLKWQDVMNLFSKEIRDSAYAKYPRLGVVPPPPSVSHDAESEEPGEKSKTNPDADLRDVRERLHYKDTKNGSKVISDIINLNIILTYDPRWQGVLKYDEFAQVLKFTKPPPWHEDDAGKCKSDVWTDEDVTRLDLWLRRIWAVELPGEKIREGVYVVGRRDAYNPLVDYLESVKWDGVARLETWLSMYLGCTDNDYSHIAGRKWLLSAVARAYEPGCPAHHVLILEGAQGKGKSTAAAALVPQRSWFSDTPIDINSKDAFVALRGKFIIELAELASLKKADLDRVKSFFTSPIDNYRPPYGRELIAVPRTCVFIGSVNLGEYLVDATGARRFWPVRVGSIDTETLRADRDQIWAEAVQKYKDWINRGRRTSECLWWPSMEEVPLFEVQQAEREVANPWTEVIALWLQSDKAKMILKSRGFINTRDVAYSALNLADKDLTASAMTSIGIVMTREMKWLKKRVVLAGARSWGYTPPN